MSAMDVQTLLSTDPPADLLKQVTEHQARFPRMDKYKGTDKIKARLKSIMDEQQSTSPDKRLSAVKKEKLQNEVKALYGKLIVERLKETGPLGYLKWLSLDLDDRPRRDFSSASDYQAAQNKCIAVYITTAKLMQKQSATSEANIMSVDPAGPASVAESNVAAAASAQIQPHKGVGVKRSASEVTVDPADSVAPAEKKARAVIAMN